MGDMMTDVIAGRVLVLVVSIIFAAWLVHDYDFNDRFWRLFAKFVIALFYVRVLAFVALDVLGLFPID
jgi:hypothetical protein